MTKQMQDFLGHWVLAMAVILVVAFLCIRQIDLYMVANDVPSSLQGAGWVADRPYSPIDVINSVYTHTPYQGPLYFILLNQWGYLVGYEIALARMLTVYCALLSLAMAYRLGRDVISPLAGNFAVVIMASNAFFNFYLANVRMYPLLVLLSATVVWLYLRTATSERPRRRGDYAALAVACAALVSTHAFGLLLYIVLSFYHLLFVRKKLRWLAVVTAACMGLALGGSPLFIALARGVDFGYDAVYHAPGAEGYATLYAAWLDMTTNGNTILLLIAAVGTALGWRQKRFDMRRCTLLMGLLVLAVGVVIFGVGIVRLNTMRYLLAGLPIAVLFQAAGLYALYCRRRLLAALIVLWVGAGLLFAQAADWSLYMPERLFSYHLPPWHLVSRTAERSGVPTQVVAFMLPESLMWAPRFGPVGLREHWFERRDIEFRWVGAIKWLEERARRYSAAGLSPWVVYQTSRIDDEMVAALESTMAEQGYQACQRVSLPVSTEMTRYGWVSLDCLPARLSVSNQVASLQYNFYGAELNADGSKLYFANKWSLQSQDALDRQNISHQLISEDWKNVEQLDQPLAPADKLRQFAIDVSDVPPGRYRLMAIVYDAATGETLDWEETSGEPPSMLFLQEVEIR